MRGCEIVRRSSVRVLTVTAVAALAALLVLASAAVAAPRPIGPPKSSWSVTKVTQGAGNVVLGYNTVRLRRFFISFDLGLQGFTFAFPHGGNDHAAPQVDWDSSPRLATREVFAQAPSLDPFRPQHAKGSLTHLDQQQIYEKDSSSASLKISIAQLLLEMVDANGPKLTPSECPLLGTPFKVLGVVPTSLCVSLRSVVRFHVRAWQVAGGASLLDLGGVVFVEGHEHDWNVGVATDSKSRGAFWEGAQFHVNPDVDGNKSQSHFQLLSQQLSGPATPITLKVPLRSLNTNALFGVQVTMDAEAIDERGGESAAQAFILDPDHAGPVLSARGLRTRRVRNLKPPPFRPLPPARCPAGPRRHAGTVQLSSPAFTVGEAMGTPLVLVTRKGGSHGATSVIVDTSGGTARSGADFKPTRTVVRFENGDTSPRLVQIPIREDLQAESPESFRVTLAHVRCSRLGQQRLASVTILDDDQPPPPPPPTFTIGGTVDGLQGSGLVLSNLGTALPVAANGSFTFPGTATSGQPYDIRVTTQPNNPSQLCAIDHGTGTVPFVNVTDIAVHCATVTPPSGLDTTFGVGGHVTTPGSGDARAVLVQPSGRIVTVGSRQVATTFHSQFGATGHDASGNLDPSFGIGGVASTSLGGADDKAFDAAPLPGGGFVAVGQADPAGLANIDFGVVRYTADGQSDPSFGTNGVVTTDISGRDDAAHAVAVQPDGKIVAAGVAQTSPINFDFALVRYNPDGTLDRSFGANGIVTTDLGSLDDIATGVAIQSDGKIVAVGDTGENVALARYLPDGRLDPTFGGGGTVVSDLGFDDVANGVAITPGGTIVIAGTRLGPRANLDAMVASYGPNGKLNLGFGNFGIADTDLSAGDDFGDDLILKPDGDIVLVGSATSATSPPLTDMALVRYRLDGTVAASLTTDFNGTGDFGHALAIDPQGRIVAAGTSGDEFALMRANL